jgi:spore coat protein U-like protein
MRRRSVGITLLSLALATAPLVPFSVSAATVTASMSVNLTPASDCRISANSLNFSTSGVLADNTDDTTTLAVTCSNGTAYNIGFGWGRPSHC